MNILITDGDNRSALAVTRSIGRQGHRVVVSASTMQSLSASSRFCAIGVAVPDPLTAPDNYISAVCNLVRNEKIEIIFPMTEQSIYLLSPLRNCQLKQQKIACPPQEMMQAVSDKVRLFQLAQKLGVGIPQTFYLKNAEDLSGIIEQIRHFPVVVKPSQSRMKVGNQFIAGDVRYAQDRVELEDLYFKNIVLKHPSMIQEKIIGPGTGLFTLYDGHRHLALFSHKRLREKPPSGGVSVVSQSVPLDDEMVDAADRLLSAVGFQGVAMVEFKRDLRDGKAKLMEINGRFWGSLQLAVKCGVDFPVLYLNYLQGKIPEKLVADYQIGHQLKWFFGTMDHFLIRIKSKDHNTWVPGSRAQALNEFLKIWQAHTSFDVAQLGDMKPFYYEAASYIKELVGLK